MNDTETPPDKPEFDPATATAMQAAGAKKLLASLKAVQNANKASSDREFAVGFVRAQEAVIHQLFDAGLSPQAVLLRLIDSLPAIPTEDLRYALKTVGRRSKRFNNSAQPVNLSAPIDQKSTCEEKIRQQPVPSPAKETKTKSAPIAAASMPKTTMANVDWPAWADGSDKRADESDEDYRFRKEIEGPPEARRKFIGEHDT